VAVIVGLALLTARDAQELIIGLLLTSPEYDASNPYVPEGTGLIGDELGITPLVTVTVDTVVGLPEHVPVTNSR
jgi:hypothetical protein